MTGVRGHEPTCPIARETWCLWTGDKCDHCVAYRRGYADGLEDARAAVEDSSDDGRALTALAELAVAP